MKISIISTGNELLKGSIVNINLAIIGHELYKLGIVPIFGAIVQDTPKDITRTLEYILPISDIIIITGGLGPTRDDLTVKTIADYFNLKLYINQQIINEIKKFLGRQKKELSEENLKQAFIPKNSEFITNKNGTAPGIYIKINKKKIFLLPGPPNEMSPMLFKKILPVILAKQKQKAYYQIINVMCIAEAELQQIVSSVIPKKIKNLEIAYRVTPKSCELTLTSHNKKVVEQYKNKIRKKLGTSVLSPEYKNVVEEIASHLKKLNLTLATAESCTGGLIASKIIEIPGASEFFIGSIIAYNNKIKKQLLEVSQETLNKFGAVSEECVKEMALGLCKNLETDLGIAVTGIAGPAGETLNKPIGLVFIAINFRGKVNTKKINMPGNRNAIRENTTIEALEMIRQLCLSQLKKR